MNEEIELSLGLSLNGRFGVDPNSKSSKRSLQRSSSSSAPEFLELSREPHVVGIGRTCSLPVETEREARKRKEAEMLRRMEAKRKMSAKQRVLCRKSDDDDDENVVRVENLGCGFGSMGRIFENYEYEFHGQTPSPGTRSTETKSPQSVFSFTEQNEYHQPTHHSAIPKTSSTKPSQTSSPVTTESKQSQTSLRPQETIQDMTNMPCVSTKANGPNGKRVEGFLYGYRKGEEVRIICICHGSSLSPAEFIRHAGGGDVEHPLRHIVVNPSPCSSLATTRECMAMSKTF